MNLYYVDLFCGAGGVTTGVIRAGGKVIACINHDPLAIKSHKSNYRSILHFTEDIRNFNNLNPLVAAVSLIRARDPQAIIVLWLSPDCTHFSKAKGGESRDADSRTLARHIYHPDHNYIKAIDPDYIEVENVMEFLSWGPLRIACAKKHADRSDLKWKIDKKTGEFEHCWIPISKDAGRDYVEWYQHICSEYGYDYDWRKLNVADFGGRTSRERYFGQFKKKHLPHAWPMPTHAKKPVRNGLFKGLRKWKAVRPCLDLDQEGTSIFSDKSKVKSHKTYHRLYQGCIKHVGNGKEPAFINEMMELFAKSPKTETNTTTQASPSSRDSVFIMKYFSGKPHGKVKSIDEPLGSVTTFGGGAIVQPEFIMKYLSNSPETGISNPVNTNEPAPTITTQNRLALVNPEFLSKYFSGDGKGMNIPTDGPAGAITTKDHHALVQAKFFLHQRNSGDPKSKVPSIDDPSRTITGTGGNLDLVSTSPAFISKYHGSAKKGISFEEPASTITTKDRLAVVWIDKQYTGPDNHQGIEQPSGSILTNDKHCLVKAIWIDKAYSGQENHQSVEKPLGTILTKDKYALIEAEHFLMNNYSGGGESNSTEGPAPAVTTVPKSNVVKAEKWLLNHNYDNTGKSIDEPAPTLLAGRKFYYLVDAQFSNTGRDIEKPMWTLIARMDKKPPYMVVAETGEAVIAIYEDDPDIIKKIKLFMAAYGIIDIKLRMLSVRELLRIQGFGEKYKLMGNQGDQKKFIGNSVHPLIVKKMVEAKKKRLAEWFAERQKSMAG